MTATQNFAPAILQEVEPTPLLKISFACFCIFLLANYSRFFEWKLIWMHVVLISSIVALVGAAMEGRLTAVFTSKIGLCMTVLTGLYAVNVPLSTWRRGSIPVFEDWLKVVTVFAIAGALIFNVRQCRIALHSIGWATGIAGVLVNWKGEVIEGRLTFGKGTFHNPNQVAFDLLLGLPFLWLVLKDPHINKVKKLLALCLMVGNLAGIVRSGSRGGLIGVAVLCLLYFLRSSMVVKLAMAFVGIMTVAGVLVVMPNSLKIRYTTLVSGAQAAQGAQNYVEARGVESAESSSYERRRLLMASIAATLSHPIFGVGIGQFAVYEVRIDTAQGRHSGWQGTHNTYTQVSSEAGIPALIAFVCMIVFSILGVQKLSRRAKKLPRREGVINMLDITFALTAALTFYAVCVCFDYIAYSATLPILAGLTISLVRCGNPELDRLERAPASEQPDPFLNLFPARSRAPRPVVLGPASGARRP